MSTDRCILRRSTRRSPRRPRRRSVRRACCASVRQAAALAPGRSRSAIWSHCAGRRVGARPDRPRTARSASRRRCVSCCRRAERFGLVHRVGVGLAVEIRRSRRQELVGLFSAKGVTFAHCGVTALAKHGAVGRHVADRLVPLRPRRSVSDPSLARSAMTCSAPPPCRTRCPPSCAEAIGNAPPTRPPVRASNVAVCAG